MKTFKIAISRPFRQTFDYLPPKVTPAVNLRPGMRVQVPFGRQTVVGMVVGLNPSCELAPKQLKAIQAVIDEEPILPLDTLALALWASDYYQHPIGEVLLGVLPKALREGKPEKIIEETVWQVTSDGWQVNLGDLTRAPKQAQALRLLRETKAGLTSHVFSKQEIPLSVLKSLLNKNWVQCEVRSPANKSTHVVAAPLTLNHEQQGAVDSIRQADQTFKTFLLEGVTGSGKTEVYFYAIEQQLQHNKQALVLVPEISLTPQTLKRFQERFKGTVASLHSGMTDKERLNVWCLAKKGEIDILIGTRSAIFTPMPKLGVIIIDESHDTSFKQHEGFRYHARDLAVYRAQKASIPIVLGSATPSLESLYNVSENRFERLSLNERAGNAKPPHFRLVDMHQHSTHDGLSTVTLERMRAHLSAGNQVMLFLNRRGFAPILHCHDCGWTHECAHCDVNMTVHQRPKQLRCHHCGAVKPVPASCPECHSQNILMKGVGTERLTQTVQALFPEEKIAQIDRDTTRKKGELQRLIDSVHQNKRRIIIGTQMVAKGHHFSNLTLVVVLQADAGLFSSDFRGSERFGQLLMQVSGRAGRAEQMGEVLIQTYHADHPLLNMLIQQGYQAFSSTLLAERRSAHLPPYAYHATLQAEALSEEEPLLFLKAAKDQATLFTEKGGQLLGPVPAVIARRANHHRAHLLLQAPSRRVFMQALPAWLQAVSQLPQANKIRWVLDVDPVDGL